MNINSQHGQVSQCVHCMFTVILVYHDKLDFFAANEQRKLIRQSEDEAFNQSKKLLPLDQFLCPSVL